MLISTILTVWVEGSFCHGTYMKKPSEKIQNILEVIKDVFPFTLSNLFVTKSFLLSSIPSFNIYIVFTMLRCSKYPAQVLYKTMAIEIVGNKESKCSVYWYSILGHLLKHTSPYAINWVLYYQNCPSSLYSIISQTSFKYFKFCDYGRGTRTRRSRELKYINLIAIVMQYIIELFIKQLQKQLK